MFCNRKMIVYRVDYSLHNWNIDYYIKYGLQMVFIIVYCPWTIYNQLA